MDIYLLPLPDRMEEFRENLLACIDAEKRHRLLRFRQLDDVDRSLIADIFIREAAIRRFGLRNQEIRFGIGSWVSRFCPWQLLFISIAPIPGDSYYAP